MANKAERRLAEIRAARDATRSALLTRAERLKHELAPGRIGERVVADLKFRAREAAVQAIEIASDNRGVLAGTLAAAALWLARRQALDGAMALWQHWQARTPAPDGSSKPDGFNKRDPSNKRDRSNKDDSP